MITTKSLIVAVLSALVLRDLYEASPPHTNPRPSPTCHRRRLSQSPLTRSGEGPLVALPQLPRPASPAPVMPLRPRNPPWQYLL